MSYRGGKAIELFKIVAEAEKICEIQGHRIEERVCHFNLPGSEPHTDWPKEKAEILAAYKQRHGGNEMSPAWTDAPHGIMRPYYGLYLFESSKLTLTYNSLLFLL
jgi:hypothetical protein